MQARPGAARTDGSLAAPGGGFFAYHGAWAPGVRLFRRLRFSVKALLISAMFVVPLAVLAWSFYTNLGGQIDFSGKERLGVEYARRVAPLLQLGQAWRAALAAGTASDAPARLQPAMEALAQAEGRLGAELGTQALHGELVQAHRVLADSPSTAHVQAFVKAVLALGVQATDGSNLTLDPDIDSYYLMDGSLFRLPDLIDQAAQLRDLASDVAGRGTATAEQSERLGALLAIIEYMDANLEGGLVKTLALRPAMKAVLAADEVRAGVGRLRAAAKAALTDQGAARPQAQALRQSGDATAEALGALQLRMLDQLDGLLAERLQGMQRQRTAVSALLLVFLPAAAYLFMAFYRVMQGGLAEVQRHLRSMTSGDLTTSPRPWGADEAAHLMLELRSMQDAMRSIVSAVRDTSDSVVAASGQIANGSQDLSARTETVAAKVQQSAAAMEQVSGTSRQTAEHVGSAGDIAGRNASAATHGGEVMSRMVQTMQDIQQASQRIGDIIGVIDGIAFQTNILALNAAVEAARAGESGRGFAVVASEVRALAGRSATAAAEIKQLITSSSEQVDNGTRIVSEAGQAIEQIVQSSTRVQQLLQAIGHGALEQAQGMSAMGTMIQEVDASTQQNAALVEQTAAAATQLADTARTLAGHVASFQLPTQPAFQAG